MAGGECYDREMKALLVFVSIALASASAPGAEQTVGPAAKQAAGAAGSLGQTTTEEKLARALTLVNVHGYPHRNQKDGSENASPPGGPSPYEWDSLRTSEEMLKNRDGGSCGTHGLSLAAILRASGVPSDDIRVVAAVNADEYSEVCPGKAGEKRAKSWTLKDDKGKDYKTDVHPTSGHVYLMVKMSGRWYLVNTTHDPLEYPVSKKSAAYRALAGGASRDAAAKLLTLDDYEKIPFGDPSTLSLTGAKPPTLIRSTRFPSLAAHMDSDPPQPMVVFQSWKFEDYPKHTHVQRNNLVASGKKDDGTCRWSGAQVTELARPVAAAGGKPKGGH